MFDVKILPKVVEGLFLKLKYANRIRFYFHFLCNVVNISSAFCTTSNIAYLCISLFYGLTSSLVLFAYI